MIGSLPTLGGSAGGEDDEAKKRLLGQPTSGGGGNADADVTKQTLGLSGGSSTSAQPVQQPQTFAQMQAAGVARPAPPPAPVPIPMQQTGGPNMQMPQLDPRAPGGAPSPVNPFLPPTIDPRAPGGPSPVAPGVPPQTDPRAPASAPSPVAPGMPPQPPPYAPPTAPSPVAGAGAGGAGYAGASGGLGGTITDMIQKLLANPSQYGNEDFQQLVASGGRQIDDQYAGAKTGVDEEMARRGIYDSTIAGGRLHDLNIGKRGAQVELQDRANQFLAQKRADDMRSALGLGTNFYNAEADRGLQAAGMAGNRADNAADLQLRRELGLGGLDLERDQLGLQRDQLGKQYGLDDRAQTLREQESTFGQGLSNRQEDYRQKEGDRRYGLDESGDMMQLINLLFGQTF